MGSGPECVDAPGRRNSPELSALCMNVKVVGGFFVNPNIFKLK